MFRQPRQLTGQTLKWCLSCRSPLQRQCLSLQNKWDSVQSRSITTFWESRHTMKANDELLTLSAVAWVVTVIHRRRHAHAALTVDVELRRHQQSASYQQGFFKSSQYDMKKKTARSLTSSLSGCTVSSAYWFAFLLESEAILFTNVNILKANRLWCVGNTTDEESTGKSFVGSVSSRLGQLHKSEDLDLWPHVKTWDIFHHKQLIFKKVHSYLIHFRTEPSLENANRAKGVQFAQVHGNLASEVFFFPRNIIYLWLNYKMYRKCVSYNQSFRSD